MDEQRLQAYYQLIESLLSCPSGEEPEILAANTELLDADFVQVVAAAAEHSAQQGQENTANWLRNLATYLTTPETPAITEADIETYGQFILEVLQATGESNGDPQVIYPLLEANTDKLNPIFAELLRRWATHTLAEAEPDKATFIAAVIGEFSNLINQFPLGSKANNIEIAITGYEIIQTVYTRSAFPELWATLQNNLATAYSDRILGEKAENLEKAIASFTAALEVYTRSAFPQDWAMTQNNLGNAYSDRILGEKAENIEQAIASFTAALEVRTRSAFPQQWATTQNNLGNAYSDRILGEKAENLEKAIASFTAALEVYTRTAFPQQWAMTQNNLATAYSDRILGEKAENLEKAITSYTAALEVYTRSAFPQDWATTQNNLGNAYRNRILGEKAENIEQAIASFTAALEVYTRSAFPQDWAMTQNNLGNAYSDRILGEKAENIEQAITSFTAALEVRTRTAFPQNHAETLLNLGILYQEEQQFDSAYNTFTQAIATVESIRGEIKSGEEAKRKQAEEWNQLYHRMIEVCLALNKDTEAIEYIERSKTRNLVELLTKADSATTENLPLVNNSIKFAEIQNLLDNQTAIIQWYIFSDCFRAFIITHDKLTIWQSEEQDLDALLDWTKEYLLSYYNPEDNHKNQWRNQLAQRLQKLADILHIEEILDIAKIPQHYKLILIPHRFLHLFPLHALPVGESYLFDLFPKGVGYAPSCQILKQLQLRQRPNFESLVAIQTPTEDLYEKDLGAVTAIKKQFANAYVLKQAKAQKSKLLHINENPPHTTLNKELIKANCVFFFCHGYFNLNSPLDSGLQLADDNLTLTDIITHFKLDNCRLVNLSVCETGVIDSTNTSDEYIGLPSGFLLAGSTNVVSSLWTVDATATALLMIKFYEELHQQSSIILALNTAQRWLRDTTVQGFQDWLGNSALSLVWQTQLNQYFTDNYQSTSIQPFASPFYWAAFSTIGKGD
ncbi:CHAT domain-containing protein [Nostoc sp. LEGE 06077]|uniref:CHAT domain-containing protein n=1 Tax=Nostoc sp. LEGE 06077 TaxID=915325 RepID=UPI0018811EB2|nr:CHAT domain-containing protein [Nostoc sp. LEGE 06077]MBE9207279.1 CHAT domain-containing protein [Nostoc sp. LEGE 06077]